MKENIRKLFTDENAQGLAEYVLIMFILVIASLGMFKLFINAWQKKFNKISYIRAGISGVLP